MPSGLIEDENGVSTGGDFGCDFVEVKLHGLGVAGRQHEGCASSTFGADRTEQIGRLSAFIVIGSRTSIAGLQAAKAKGKQLGNPTLKAKPGTTLAENNRALAVQRDKAIEPVLRELQHLSPQNADELQRRGLGKMSLKTVKRARVRLGLEG